MLNNVLTVRLCGICLKFNWSYIIKLTFGWYPVIDNICLSYLTVSRKFLFSTIISMLSTTILVLTYICIISSWGCLTLGNILAHSLSSVYLGYQKLHLPELYNIYKISPISMLSIRPRNILQSSSSNYVFSNRLLCFHFTNIYPWFPTVMKGELLIPKQGIQTPSSICG